MLKNRILVAFGAVAAAIFLYGMVQLLLLRFSAGDVYPPYSSLRGDPLGAKALYESLDECCGLEVSRNYEPFEAVKNRTDAVLLFAGEDPPLEDLLPVSFLEDLEFLLRNGGRIVVTYSLPEDVNIPAEKKDADQTRKKAKDKDRKKGGEGEEKQPDMVSFSKRWGLVYSQYPLEGATEARVTPEFRGAGLPESLYWHSRLCFDRLDPAWRVLYRREGKPVMIERQMGRGSVVLSADSYFLSNEAMLRHRYPALLAWLIGDKKTVLFDEYFHGIAANPGVATLARRYRLHGLLAGILLLVALYIWRNAISLVPRYPAGPPGLEGTAEGKDSASGLTNLLRRSISSRQVLAVCWQEWKKSQAQGAKSKQHLDKAEALFEAERSMPAKRSDPVAAYNRISNILKER